MKSSTRQCDRRERSWRPRFTTAGQRRKTNTVKEPKALGNIWKNKQSGAEGREGPLADGAKGNS